MEYETFVRSKSAWSTGDGIKGVELPTFLFDFQSFLVEWSLAVGRGLIAADCGLGKTPMQLVWANELIKRMNKPALLVTPIAVGQQTVSEAEKFGIEAKRTRDGHLNSSSVIWVTNYEQLHKYDPSMFCAVVCDESSAIKDFKSQRKAVVTEFLKPIKYRLLCTATAAPNDYWEVGTSSEALGLLGFRDMITTFFKQETTKDRLGWGRTKYRFRGHAEEPFWAWVCSFARSLRRPSDLGFDDGRFELPPLREHDHIVTCDKPRPGMLFAVPGKTMQDERAERRLSIEERCDMAVRMAESKEGPSVSWVELDAEGDMLTKMLSGSVQVHGRLKDEEKEEILVGFSKGDIQRLVIKPKIGAWGLNWQHCSNVTAFPSHSYEQYYQAIRRCYRFGQKNIVDVHRILNDGEIGVLNGLKRKSEQADVMFTSIVRHMKDAMHLASRDYFPDQEEVPSWL